jgi:hypothetical protein
MVFRWCRIARSGFSDLSDGQPVPFGVALMARVHLTICPQCRRVHRSLAETRRALRALRDTDFDPDVASGDRSRERR